jgi:hypothetical protein
MGVTAGLCARIVATTFESLTPERNVDNDRSNR